MSNESDPIMASSVEAMIPDFKTQPDDDGPSMSPSLAVPQGKRIQALQEATEMDEALGMAIPAEEQERPTLPVKIIENGQEKIIHTRPDPEKLKKYTDLYEVFEGEGDQLVIDPDLVKSMLKSPKENWKQLYQDWKGNNKNLVNNEIKISSKESNTSEKFIPPLVTTGPVGGIATYGYGNNHAPVFREIVDVNGNCAKGNFYPAVYCLSKGYLKDRNYVDGSGYNLIHHIVSYNNIELVGMLLDHFGYDVNAHSSTKQTPLMIACNFNYLEMVKFLVSKGADINAVDAAHFTALLYASKEGHLPLTCYLLYKGADPSCRDPNGCSLVHWAAFKNDVFLARMYKRLGLPQDDKDLAGYTPMERAIANNSYDVVKEYCQDNDDICITKNPNIKLDQIASKSMLKFLKQKEKKELNQKTTLERYSEKIKEFSFGGMLIYLFTILCFYGIYMKHAVPRGSFVGHIVFNVLALYFVLYVILVIRSIRRGYQNVTKTSKTSQKKSESQNTYISLKTTDGDQDTTLQNEEGHTHMAFEYADKLLATSAARNQESNLNFYPLEQVPQKVDPVIKYPNNLFYQVGYLCDSVQYKELREMDFARWCPTCLSYKAPKTKHCRECRMCVPLCNHHSSFFDTCLVQAKNHLWYYLLVLQQTVLLLYFIILIISYYWHLRTASILLVIPETIHQMAVNGEILTLIVFVGALVLFVKSAIITAMDGYAILTYLTRNELLNMNRYNYLFAYMKRPNNQVAKSFNHPDDKGPADNLSKYLKYYLQ